MGDEDAPRNGDALFAGVGQCIKCCVGLVVLVESRGRMATLMESGEFSEGCKSAGRWDALPVQAGASPDRGLAPLRLGLLWKRP